MKNLKKYVLGITLFCLVGCQPKPEVLFENIYIGDNLETCLAKGTVQNNPDYNKETVIKNDISMIELANNNIANERANPTSKKIPFLLSRSAFGDFFISILFNFYSSHNFAGKGKENHNICQDFKFFFSNIPALTIF